MARNVKQHVRSTKAHMATPSELRRHKHRLHKQPWRRGARAQPSRKFASVVGGRPEPSADSHDVRRTAINDHHVSLFNPSSLCCVPLISKWPTTNLPSPRPLLLKTLLSTMLRKPRCVNTIVYGVADQFQEIKLMKQRVAEMEREANKLRELQAAAEQAAAAEEGGSQFGDDDKHAADIRSIYIGNVCFFCLSMNIDPCPSG